MCFRQRRRARPRPMIGRTGRAALGHTPPCIRPPAGWDTRHDGPRRSASRSRRSLSSESVAGNGPAFFLPGPPSPSPQNLRDAAARFCPVLDNDGPDAKRSHRRVPMIVLSLCLERLPRLKQFFDLFATNSEICQQRGVGNEWRIVQ